MAGDIEQNIVLGISRDNQYSFSLGFETQRDIPFIIVMYPHDRRKELYWREAESNSSDSIAVMSTHPDEEIALQKPLIGDLIRTLVTTTEHVRYEKVTVRDARLQGMQFVRD